MLTRGAAPAPGAPRPPAAPGPRPWGLSRQLNNFARAAEGFSVEGENQQLPESGPQEIAQLARALNRMRDRITGLLSDRTRMLSAIGHDLRTPITRLRLRASPQHS